MRFTANHIKAANSTIPNPGKGSLFFMILETGQDPGGLLFPDVETLEAEKGCSAQPLVAVTNQLMAQK